MTEEHNKTDAEVSRAHFEFFARNNSGCAFAAYAGKAPAEFGWHARIVREAKLHELEQIIEEAISDDAVSTLSLIFPDHHTDLKLDALIPQMQTEKLFLHEMCDPGKNRCYRFRARVGSEESFVSGFGPFDYFPVTRRSPDTSIVMRVSPRPHYEWYLKEPEEGIIHVADMDMCGLERRQLERMWNNSFLTTAGLLGKKPDDESAAKTTFVIPLERATQISL